jgi:hypothetical protein
MNVDRAQAIVDLRDKMKRLTAELQIYSPEWTLVGKSGYEGHTSSITDSYIQREFKDNGHSKGWIAVYVSERNYFDKNGQNRYKYFVRLASSSYRSTHCRNWSFRTNDLPEKIHGKSEEMAQVVAKEIAEEREQKRLEAEARKELTAQFKDVPGWKFKQGNSYSLSSEITVGNQCYSIQTYNEKGKFKHTIELSYLEPNEIAAVVEALKEGVSSAR